MNTLAENATVKDAVALLEQGGYHDAWLRGEENARPARERVLSRVIHDSLECLQKLSEDAAKLDRERADLDAKIRREMEELEAVIQMAKASSH